VGLGVGRLLLLLLLLSRGHHVVNQLRARGLLAGDARWQDNA